MAFVTQHRNDPADSPTSRPSRDCGALLAQLAADDPTARRWAARELVDCPEAAGPLVARLEVEQIPSVREVLLTTLVRLGGPVVVRGLVNCLRLEDAALRNGAIDALKELPDAVAPVMQGLLADPDPDVRISAVSVLESLRHPEVEAWLIQVIETDPHVNVCATAVDLLGEVGTVAAQAPLARLAVRFAAEPYIRFATDVAARRIRVG